MRCSCCSCWVGTPSAACRAGTAGANCWSCATSWSCNDPTPTASPARNARFLAARSQPDPQALKGPGGQITFIWQNPLAVSATQIRGLLATGKSIRFLVPDAVLDYIRTHGLYPASSEPR